MPSALASLRAAFRFLFFTWITPMVRYGCSHPLEIQDMPELPESLHPTNVSNKFHRLPVNGPWKFLFGVMGALKGSVTKMVVLATVMIVLQVSAPILIRSLLNGISGVVTGDLGIGSGVALALLLSFVKIVQALTEQHYLFTALISQQQAINGINLRIYLRSLKLSRIERQRRPVGDIVNYLGTDTNEISMFSWFFVELCYSVVLILALFMTLFAFLGMAALAALAVLVIISPLARISAGRLMKYDEELMKHRDKRVSMISQIITGVRIVKSFTWEELIKAEVSGQRKIELGFRSNIAIVESLASLLYLSSSTLACIAAFSCYLYLGNPLTAGTIFASIALFKTLEEPIGKMTGYIATLAAAKIGAKRILNFLGSDESATIAESVSPKSHPIGVELIGFSARYEDAPGNAITDCSLSIPAGQSLAIVGPVGAGKTSLLLALLSEIPRVSGQVNFTNIAPNQEPNTGWVPQEPFIRNTTLRENIVFGSDATGIEEALVATAFDEDVLQFPAGLATEIGEQGITLSGGQKQRVSLARVAMARPGLVLLDDPLSAVDVATEAKIVERLIFGMWRNITRIVVTHRLEHLKSFDQVAFIDDGKLLASGTFAHLLANNERFAAFYEEHERSNAHQPTPLKALKGRSQSAPAELMSGNGQPSSSSKEDREIGAVGLQVYFQYLKAMAGPPGWRRFAMLAAIFSISIAAAGIPIVQNLWLSIWTNGQPGESFFTRWIYQYIGSDTRNVGIYATLGAMALVAYVIRNMVWALRSVTAGKALHERAFNAVLNAKVAFFDTNPVGRVLNRFSQDVDAVERELPWAFLSMIGGFLVTLGSFLVLAIALPPILIFLVPVFWLYYRLQADFRASGREIKRLFAISRSPRFAHFKETLEGLTVIRGMHRQSLFLDGFYETLANNARGFYGTICLNRWFSIRVPLLGGAISSAAAIGIIYATRYGYLHSGSAGMVLIYSLGLWESLNWCIRSFSEAEARMVSVERLKAYADIPPEPLTKIEGEAIDSANWPGQGEIVFENVFARYVEHLPDVLKGVSFTIEAGKKVGIIGRTGAGKSTIFQLLFRFIDVRSGRILIDGKDIAHIELPELRQNIAIIPQDPTLFMGTLRSNLDRFNQFSDHDVWQVLERVQMATFFRGLGKGLEAEVQENGHNFSQGQRQLLCLGRALLVRAKIIVMDEATANVDVATDALIQETVRRECKHQTVVIIAHRLGTVADCDLVIELANGLVASTRAPRDITLAQKNWYSVMAEQDLQMET